MPPIPWRVNVHSHPGSSAEDIKNEPSWDSAGGHRVGYTNLENRVPGLTHEGDEPSDEDDEERPLEEEAVREFQSLKDRKEHGDLINFRDIVQNEKDFHLRYHDNRSLGWRFVLNASEDWVKNEEDWPANQQKRQKQEEAKKKEDEKNKEKNGDSGDGGNSDKDGHKDETEEKGGDDKKSSGNEKNQKQPQQEHEWKREQGEDKHHDAYATNKDQGRSSQSDISKGEEKSEDEKLRAKYTPQEVALLRVLQHEKDYIVNLEQNDGNRVSPMKGRNRTTISIDEADQFSPDNWIPRSDDLIRLTGKHPLNAEAHLDHLYDAGLITPNELHYVRNHGAVPHLLWEFHTLDVENGALKLSMDDIKNKFDSVNIPVALACDGNRRKELNLIRRSKGFNWGAGAVSCAYWKGPLLRDVLLAAGVENTAAAKAHAGKRYWVNFEGADDPSEGKYATCIPLQYALDPTNDVILAYEMNNEFLPPDHGYPLRLMIPGYVGGRCIKWLKRIWVSDKENDSHYHIWDNRVLPAFVTEKDGEFATALFNHPDTACNEQNLNSVIVKPAHGTQIPLTSAKKGKTFRIEGYAYDGGGHEVQRVEVSLDDGKTWLYCIRKFPDAPIRHGNKFWTWLHWHIDVELTHLLQAKKIICRCFNVFKNTQPEQHNWNSMGMMNNAWYEVHSEITSSDDPDSDVACILFRHPVEPGTGDGGWMKPSVENRIAQTKQEAGTPQKQFTREEIEKHSSEDDCWIVVDGKVYDATSVLAWHPGGKSAITGHAGKVHQETSDEFSSIHDDFAYAKLKECILGTVTDKAKEYIKHTAEAKAKEAADSKKNKSEDIVLQKHRWVPVKLQARKSISKDTRTYTFELPAGKKELGLGTCQHVQIGFHFSERMLIRSYTPTRPLLPPLSKDEQQKKQKRTNGANGQTASEPNSTEQDSATSSSSDNDTDGNNTDAIDDTSMSMHDGTGTFDLTIKTYFPTSAQPGGAMSNILDCIPLGEEVEIRGPTGDIVYHGNGAFTIEGKKRTFKRASLVLGGSGVTPGYALIARTLMSEGDNLELRVLDANKTEGDILMREALDNFVQKHPDQLKMTHVLSHPSEEWKGKKGHVNAEIIKGALFEPTDENVVFLCGPPAMIQKAALPALKEWGYEEGKNCFGF